MSCASSNRVAAQSHAESFLADCWKRSAESVTMAFTWPATEGGREGEREGECGGGRGKGEGRLRTLRARFQNP